MIEATKAQFPKEVGGAMMAINMNLIPSKVIGKEARLQTKSPFGLSKNLKPMKRPNI
jgi:hypothetical protein